MNIAFYFYCGFNLKIGGTERVGAELAQGLKERGHNLFFIYAESKYDQAPGIPTFRLPISGTKTLGNNKNVKELKDFIIHNKVDILQVFDYSSLPAIRLVSRALQGVSCATILHFHNSPEYSKINTAGRWPGLFRPFVKIGRRLRFHAVIRAQYKHYDAVVLLSSTYIKSYQQHKPPKAKAIVTAIANPNTYNINTLLPGTQTLDRKKKNVLFVGRIDETQKGMSFLVRIWKEVHSIKPDWNLIIVGSGPSEDYVKRQNLPNCILEGRQNPLRYYQEASIFIMTSRTEGWPLVLPEAMQNYCVPIAFNSFSALREIVNEGRCGVMVKPFDIDEYVNKLIRLMDNNELRENYAVSGYEYITSNFQTSSILDEWESLYTSLVEQKQNKKPR